MHMPLSIKLRRQSSVDKSRRIGDGFDLPFGSSKTHPLCCAQSLTIQFRLTCDWTVILK